MCNEVKGDPRLRDLGPVPGDDYSRAVRFEAEKAAQSAQNYAKGGVDDGPVRPPVVLRELYERREALYRQRASIDQKLDTLNAVLNIFES